MRMTPEGSFEIVQNTEGLPTVDEYLSISVPDRAGLWPEIDSDQPFFNYESFQFARLVQLSMKGKDLAGQERIVADSLDDLDRLAVDIKDRRAAINIHDDSWVSGDVGGYSIIGENKCMIALRLYEVAADIKSTADYDPDGRRLAGPVYAPVLAVRGLSLISK